MANERSWSSGRALAHNQRIPLDHPVRIIRAIDDAGNTVTTLKGVYKGPAVVSPKARILLNQFDARFAGQNVSRADGVMELEVDPTVLMMRRPWASSEG